MALHRGGTNNSRKLEKYKTHTIVTKNCIRLTAVGFNKCLVFTNALKFHERKKENMTTFFSVKIRMLSALVSFLFYLCIFWRTEKPWAQTENWYLRQKYLKIIHTHRAMSSINCTCVHTCYFIGLFAHSGRCIICHFCECNTKPGMMRMTNIEKYLRSRSKETNRLGADGRGTDDKSELKFRYER